MSQKTGSGFLTALALMLVLSHPIDAFALSASISTPSHGATVSGAINIEVSGVGGESSQRVQFYIDDQYVGDSISEPFIWTWDTTAEAEGSHSIRAVYLAYMGFSRGHDSVEKTITVAVENTSPSVAEPPPPSNTPTPLSASISTPSHEATVSGITNIEVSGAGGESSQRVQFYIDDNFVGEATSEPFIWTWDTTAGAKGPHSIRAVYLAYMGFSRGHDSVEKTITVTVTEPPPPSDPPPSLSDPVSWQDIVIGTGGIEGGASGVQLVYEVDVANVHKVPATADDPYWWQYYRSFWDDNGVFIGDVAPNAQMENPSTGDPCPQTHHWSLNFQTVAFGPGQNYYCPENLSGQFRKGTFFATLYGAHAFAKNRTPIRVRRYHWIPHFRRRIEDESGRIWYPLASTLGPFYRLLGPERGWTFFNFHIRLNQFIETDAGDFGTFKAGYWRTVIAGEVTREGWGIVPAPSLNNRTGGLQWIYIIPQGAEVKVLKNTTAFTADPADTTACSIGDIEGGTPCIVDPRLWTSSSGECQYVSGTLCEKEAADALDEFKDKINEMVEDHAKEGERDIDREEIERDFGDEIDRIVEQGSQQEEDEPVTIMISDELEKRLLEQLSDQSRSEFEQGVRERIQRFRERNDALIQETDNTIAGAEHDVAIAIITQALEEHGYYLGVTGQPTIVFLDRVTKAYVYSTVLTAALDAFAKNIALLNSRENVFGRIHVEMGTLGLPFNAGGRQIDLLTSKFFDYRTQGLDNEAALQRAHVDVIRQFPLP